LVVRKVALLLQASISLNILSFENNQTQQGLQLRVFIGVLGKEAAMAQPRSVAGVEQHSRGGVGIYHL
jgi:hypothetical protein